VGGGENKRGRKKTQEEIPPNENLLRPLKKGAEGKVSRKKEMLRIEIQGKSVAKRKNSQFC